MCIDEDINETEDVYSKLIDFLGVTPSLLIQDNHGYMNHEVPSDYLENKIDDAFGASRQSFDMTEETDDFVNNADLMASFFGF